MASALFNHRPQKDVLSRLTTAKQRITRLSKAIETFREVLRKMDRHDLHHVRSEAKVCRLFRLCSELVDDVLQAYLRDSLDAVVNMKGQVKGLLNLLDGAFKSYTVKVTR